MPVIARQLKRLLLVAICVAWIVPWAMMARGLTERPEIPEEHIALVEHSSEVFIGAIDIVTAVSGGDEIVTDYTVLVSEVHKGDLSAPTMVVARQRGGLQLVPGSSYLLFVRFLPAELRYEIVGLNSGILPVASDDDRTRLTGYWTYVIAQTSCDHTDILALDGVIYARRDWNDERRFVPRERVGATIATIRFQDTSATGCRDDLPDGVASEVPVGTKVQRLDGYEPTFRVAVRKRDGHRHLYEAIRSETAETGADLLDIDGRVALLSYEGKPDTVECDDTSLCAAPPELKTDDQAVIGRVLSILAAAPAAPDRTNWRTNPPERLDLRFTLDDGSNFDLVISLRTGLTPSGIEVPVDELIELLAIE